MNKLLENNIIRLRAMEPEDLEPLYKWENDTALWKYGSTLSPFSRFALKQYLLEAQQDIYQSRQLRLMVELVSDKTPIGTVDLYEFDAFHQRAGVGILIDNQFQNKGYGAASLDLLEKYAFDFLRLHQVYSFIPLKNTRSIRLFEKSGYEQTGMLKEWLAVGNEFDDVIVMQKFNIKP